MKPTLLCVKPVDMNMPQNVCDVKDVTSLIVNFRDGISYDDNTRISSKGRYATVIRFCDAEELLHMLLNIDNDVHSDNNILCTILEIIKNIGYSQTTFNFECCDGCGNNTSFTNSSNITRKNNISHFKNEIISRHVINLIDYVLDKSSYVMFADFSFKALIQYWDNEKWGKCPFRNISTIHGTLHIKYPFEETQKSQFGQLSKIASMAIPDKKTDINEVSIFSMTVEALPETLVYDIHENIDPNITLYVHSIISDTAIIAIEHNTTIAHGSNNLSGIPVHTVVNFKNKPGVMIVSNVHFKELVDMNADVNSVIHNAENVLSKQRSDEMKHELLSAANCPQLVRCLTNSYVAEITNGSNPVNKTVNKRTNTF